jgi:hypothetical protein
MRYLRVSLSEGWSIFSMATVYLFDLVFPPASPSVSFLFGYLVWLGGAAPGLRWQNCLSKHEILSKVSEKWSADRGSLKSMRIPRGVRVLEKRYFSRSKIQTVSFETELWLARVEAGCFENCWLKEIPSLGQLKLSVHLAFPTAFTERRNWTSDFWITFTIAANWGSHNLRTICWSRFVYSARSKVYSAILFRWLSGVENICV